MTDEEKNFSRHLKNKLNVKYEKSLSKYKRKGNAKNLNFYQFNKKIPKILIKLSQDKPNVVSVYMLLTTLSNGLGACVIPQSSLARQLDKSTRTVSRAINYLAYHGYIAIIHSGRANAYVLNYHLIWDNYAYKKESVSKYVRFPAVIVASSKQNAKFFKKLKSLIKDYGHKYINLSEWQQRKDIKPQKDPNAGRYAKKQSKKHNSKIYASKLEARANNGYYQPSMFQKQVGDKTVKLNAKKRTTN